MIHHKKFNINISFIFAIQLRENISEHQNTGGKIKKPNRLRYRSIETFHQKVILIILFISVLTMNLLT